MNILLSSTQVWNPGDDFIRFGVLHLLQRAYGRIYTSIFDRSPRVDQGSSGRDNTQANILTRGDTLAGYDLIVIAGTPAWGRDNALLYRHAQEHRIPILMLGLGGHSIPTLNRAMCHDTRWALENALLVTVRDQVTSDYLKSLNIPHHHLPCPASLAPLYLYPDRPIPLPEPGTMAIVTSDVPEIQAEALALHAQLTSPERTGGTPARSPSPSLICHSSHERNKLVLAGHSPLYDHDPARLLQILLRYQTLHSGRLHAAIPVLAAGAGRQVHLLSKTCPRIQGGFATAHQWFFQNKLCISELSNCYATHLPSL